MTAETAPEWVIVPKEPTPFWARMLAERRQGQSASPRCEPPSRADVKIAETLIRDVLAAAPSADLVPVPREWCEQLSKLDDLLNDREWEEAYAAARKLRALQVRRR